MVKSIHLLGFGWVGIPELGHQRGKRTDILTWQNQLGNREYYWCVKRRVAGWVAGGCWDDEIDTWPVDHSRKFPA